MVTVVFVRVVKKYKTYFELGKNSTALADFMAIFVRKMCVSSRKKHKNRPKKAQKMRFFVVTAVFVRVGKKYKTYFGVGKNSTALADFMAILVFFQSGTYHHYTHIQ